MNKKNKSIGSLTSGSAELLPFVCFNNNKSDERASSSVALQEKENEWISFKKEGGGVTHFFGPDMPKKFTIKKILAHTAPKTQQPTVGLSFELCVWFQEE
jgi:hypothetical protein